VKRVAVYVSCVILGATVVAEVQTPQQQAPVFRSGVDLVAVDVQVIGANGRPVTSLSVSDFKVSIDRQPRRIVRSVVENFALRENGTAMAAAADGGPVSEAPSARRYYLIAVDETSFDIHHAPVAMQAARKFIDRLHPRDFVALFSYPQGGAFTNLTTDHKTVRRALDRVTGVRDLSFGVFNMTASEFIDVAAGDREMLERVLIRECGVSRATHVRCADQILNEARGAVAYYEGLAGQSLGALQGVLRDFERIDGRKTIVMVTGGMIQSDRGSRPDNANLLKQVGEWAGAANTSFYTIFWDSSFMEAFSATRKGMPNVQALLRDRNILGLGLERVVDSAGGEIIRVEGGTGDIAFERVLRETEAYYILGVVPEERDRNGRTHRLDVELVTGNGLSLRSRKQVFIPKR
jgi:VWFA-related protein